MRPGPTPMGPKSIGSPAMPSTAPRMRSGVMAARKNSAPNSSYEQRPDSASVPSDRGRSRFLAIRRRYRLQTAHAVPDQEVPVGVTATLGVRDRAGVGLLDGVLEPDRL